MKGTRRKAREIALQSLYEADAVKHEAKKAIELMMDTLELPEDSVIYAHEMVKGVIENIEKIDRYIKEFAPAWPLEQIPLVDRNILRLAIFEILLDNKMPVKVAINEAVELAKAFGSNNSSKFVNGVLGSVSTLAVDKKL